MDSSARTSRLELPRSILGRIAFGAVCLLLGVPSAAISYEFLFGNERCNTRVDFIFNQRTRGHHVRSLFFVTNVLPRAEKKGLCRPGPFLLAASPISW
jgi:hypothetical protein